MVNLGNWDDYDDEKTFELIAEGLHKVTITEALYKENSKKSGMMAVVTFQNEAGENVWARYNVEFYSPDKKKSQNIGRAKYKGLAKACGYSDYPNEPEDLVGHELIVNVVHRKYTDNNTGEEKTTADIKNVQAIEKAAPIDEDDDLDF